MDMMTSARNRTNKAAQILICLDKLFRSMIENYYNFKNPTYFIFIGNSSGPRI